MIKSLRQKKCISQEQLADVTGLSLRTIQRVESGQRVSDSSLQSLAEYFEVDMASIGNEESEAMDKTDAKYGKILTFLAYHRAIQLIILIVTFFIFVSLWLTYYASLNPSSGSSDTSLGTILLYISEIAAVAALLVYVFGRAPALFIRSYYFTAGSFLIMGIGLGYWIEANYEEGTTLLVFPVFYSLMFLSLCVFHVLQMALSLKSESAVVVQLSDELRGKATYLTPANDSSSDSDNGLITN